MITLIIIAITVGISVLAMNDTDLKNRFMFNPYAISRNKEWWRFFTHGVLHAHFPHLFLNMYGLWIFGSFVENAFCYGYHIDDVFYDAIFGKQKGILIYLLLYLGGLVLSSVYTYFKQKDNYSYNALGASGAVSAVVFSAILLNPLMKMGLLFIPIMIPAWIFGILFLVISWFLARKNVGNVGHDAHFWGSVYGFILPIIFKPDLLQSFIWQLKMYFQYGNLLH